MPQHILTVFAFAATAFLARFWADDAFELGALMFVAGVMLGDATRSLCHLLAWACDVTAYVWHRFIRRDLYEIGVYDEERRCWVPKDPG